MPRTVVRDDDFEVRVNRRLAQMEHERNVFKREQKSLEVAIRTWGPAKQVAAAKRYFDNPDIIIKHYNSGLIWLHSSRLDRTMIIDEHGTRHIVPQKDYIKVSNVKGRAVIIAM